jgi:hypothetical protein
MLSLSLFERNMGKSCQREYIVATPMRLNLVGNHLLLFVFVSKQKTSTNNTRLKHKIFIYCSKLLLTFCHI